MCGKVSSNEFSLLGFVNILPLKVITFSHTGRRKSAFGDLERTNKSCFGFQVVSVEPFRESIYRIHKAANLTHNTDKITIVENAVSDVRGEATIKENGDNQGDTR